MHHSQINSDIRKLIAEGTVLPAHPLALTAERQLDKQHQRALTRYYIDAGSGGLAVGVHTTQFAIRDVGLYRPVLELAAETAANWTKRPLALTAERQLDKQHQRALTRYYIDAGSGGLAVGVHTTQFAIRDVGLYRPVLELAAETAANWTKRPLAMVAGLAGPTQRAVAEARTARDIGYHAGLLSLAAMKSASEDEIIAHCTAVAAEIPLVGFYLQPAVGGVILSSRFWQRFASIDNVIAIKIAPFNRYRTLDVLRGVAAAGALDRVALYTGNDDHILLDLMLPFDLRDRGVTTRTYFKGGLLGHWSVWTASAIKQFERCKAARHKDSVPADLLALDARVTDCNSAFFDVANNFHGCIAGCHDVLRRQGLMQGLWCLDPNEGLSPGQKEEIDRVYREHADLSDDAFVADNLSKWLA
jgi:dihydrodipicolinate synthase/N-acetylneuraminate lyase